MTEVMFEGTKTFWKTKNSVSLTVVYHRLHDVLEVVTFEPAIQVEAPRLYLDVGRVVPLLDWEPAMLASVDTTFADVVSKFIFNRLSISQYLPVSGVFEVAIQRGFGSKEQGVDFQIVIERPVFLEPYEPVRAW
jgi:hypothetical protein